MVRPSMFLLSFEYQYPYLKPVFKTEIPYTHVWVDVSSPLPASTVDGAFFPQWILFLVALLKV